MKYLAITQQTADWIIGKPTLLSALYKILTYDENEIKKATVAEFVEGPLRITASSDNELLAIWNIDYLTGSGEESWGFIKITGQYGLMAHHDIMPEVMERCLNVVNQRLQGLFIDGAFIHRSYPNGAHTCLAGRGSQKIRQLSIGYYEYNFDISGASHKSIICIGPEHDFKKLSTMAEKESRNIEKYLEKVNKLLITGNKSVEAGGKLFPWLKDALSGYVKEIDEENEYGNIEVAVNKSEIKEADAYRGFGLSYTEWVKDGSSLSDVQRRILKMDAIEKHPLRIVGPAGSGKTLLMQLLAIKRLKSACEKKGKVKVLYIVHNAAMAQMVNTRFSMLIDDDSLVNEDRQLDVYTLSEYGRNVLGLDYTSIINPDAFEAKQFQLDQVSVALHEAIGEKTEVVKKSKLFTEVVKNDDLFNVLAILVMSEISIAIKGHGLEEDKRRYVQSQRQLSRFHGILKQDERDLIYSVFEKYHHVMFEQHEVLDTDDIALSLLGRLRTPIWELKRKELGYDYIFVDETQLFNENERRVMPMLTNKLVNHVPIALALDEAQDVYNQSSAGLATLGIPNIANENLSSIHRSTKAIIELAFFVIQRSIDLFSVDFPDFTLCAKSMVSNEHTLAKQPVIYNIPEKTGLAKYVKKKIQELRDGNIRQIAVICHADQYWDELVKELNDVGSMQILLERGKKLPSSEPIIILTKPVYAGGQEFDAVILIGLEQGVVPPRVIGNEALASAVEQQTIRELYLSITRAKYRIEIILSNNMSPSSIIKDAITANLITHK